MDNSKSRNDSSKLNLATVPRIGLVYQRDFEMPRHVSPSQLKVDLTCFAVKFNEFTFVHPDEHDSLIHTSETFRYDGFYNVAIVSPAFDQFASYVVLRKNARDMFTPQKDLIVQYWGGSRRKAPMSDHATFVHKSQLPHHVCKILDHDSFDHSAIEVWRIPEIVTEDIQRHPGMNLTLLFQFEKELCEPVDTRSKKLSFMKPNGPFADLTIRVYNYDEPEMEHTYYDIIKLDRNILASRSPFFRKELMAMREKVRQGHADSNYASMVEVTECSPDTFSHVLNYIYEGKIQIMAMELDEAISMYKATVHFELPELQKSLLDRITFLLQNGSGKLFEVYTMASSENIMPLKDMCTMLIAKFSEKVLYSADWDCFSSARPDLVADLLKGVTLSSV